MTDIHCHILPGIDDGADSLQTSMMMAAIAADNGVSTVVATPHVTWNHDVISDRIARIERIVDSFSASLADCHLPVKIVRGAEVLLCEVPYPAASEYEFPKIGLTDYSLVEFNFDVSSDFMSEALASLKSNGIKVIVAHPERYSSVIRNKDILRDWFSEGYALQINKGSLLGHFGRKEKSIAAWALKHRLASFVASDAHDARHRTPGLDNVYYGIASEYGEAYAEVLMRKNPELMLNNEPLISMR